MGVRKLASAAAIVCVAWLFAGCAKQPPIVHEYPLEAHSSSADEEGARRTGLYILKSVCHNKLENLWQLLTPAQKQELEKRWGDERQQVKNAIRDNFAGDANQRFRFFYGAVKAQFNELPELSSMDDVDRISTQLAFRTGLLDHTFASGFTDPAIPRDFFGPMKLMASQLSGDTCTLRFERRGFDVNDQPGPLIQAELVLKAHNSAWTYEDLKMLTPDSANEWFERYLKVSR